MIRSLFADLLAYFLVPGIIALLPCNSGMRLSRWVAGHGWFFDSEARQTLAEAERTAPVADKAGWLARHRLMRLRDQVDMYHWLIWGDRWFRRHVVLQGDWPAAPFVSATFHWGGALWALHGLRKSTGGFAGVAAPPPWAALRHRPLLYVYVRLRTWVTARLLGDGLVSPGAAARLLVRKLRAGVAICGLWDAPAQSGDKTLAVTLQGKSLKLPRGLPAMAARERLTLVLFHAFTDEHSGKVHLVIDALPTPDTEQAGANALADRLNGLIRMEPAYWHHWYLMNLDAA
ncbi:MAG: hypothetical protein JNM76_14045 [Betaproteobacteria bacterium]|nr:hypothetical protein [Betaproteobacteria bacterium]